MAKDSSAVMAGTMMSSWFASGVQPLVIDEYVAAQ